MSHGLCARPTPCMHGPDGAEVPSAANAARTSASVSVVVPMLDAGPRVDAVHAVLSELVAERGPDAELILVDDASSDDTWRRIQQLAVVDPRVVGLRLQRNVGQTSALCAGFSVATGRSVVIMDDDVECGPEDLRRFVAAIDAGADFASGWRRVGAHPSARSDRRCTTGDSGAGGCRSTMPGAARTP